MPITKEARQIRRQKWETIITAQEESHQSVREFCQGKGIRVSQFWYWRRKIRGGQKRDLVPKSHSGFIPVESQRRAGEGGARLLFPQGMVLETNILPEPSWLSSLLAKL